MARSGLHFTSTLTTRVPLHGRRVRTQGRAFSRTGGPESPNGAIFLDAFMPHAWMPVPQKQSRPRRWATGGEGSGSAMLQQNRGAVPSYTPVSQRLAQTAKRNEPRTPLCEFPTLCQAGAGVFTPTTAKIAERTHTATGRSLVRRGRDDTSPQRRVCARAGKEDLHLAWYGSANRLGCPVPCAETVGHRENSPQLRCRKRVERRIVRIQPICPSPFWDEGVLGSCAEVFGPVVAESWPKHEIGFCKGTPRDSIPNRCTAIRFTLY